PRGRRDRPARCPEPRHPHAARLRDRVARLPQVGAERLGVQRADRAMPEAMAGQLVPPLRDIADQGGELVRHPAEHEEGALGPAVVAEVERAARVRHHARGPPVPVVARDLAGERLDLEIVLDVDREDVAGLLTHVEVLSIAARGAARGRVSALTRSQRLALQLADVWPGYGELVANYH